MTAPNERLVLDATGGAGLAVVLDVAVDVVADAHRQQQENDDIQPVEDAAELAWQLGGIGANRRAKNIANPSQRERPDQRAKEREENECPEVHARDARREG